MIHSLVSLPVLKITLLLTANVIKPVKTIAIHRNCSTRTNILFLFAGNSNQDFLRSSLFNRVLGQCRILCFILIRAQRTGVPGKLCTAFILG